ncbi:MAG: glycosyltransferase, partial [Mangrovimonas sp.]|nr:glycosyltransferase [Mangrovimonas sp.]
MILISLVISIGYAFLILSLIVGFDRVKPFNPEEHEEPTRFTILIPFRNEAKNLPRLLKSLHSLNYSSAHFEVLLIDDDSEDNSVEIIEEFQKKSTLKLTILKNERRTQSPKKDAITHGVRHAKNNWILTTDADCIVPEKWLLCYNSFIQAHEANVICGAV